MPVLAVDQAALREPRLLIPRKQPQGPVAIDFTHPFSNKLFVAVRGRPGLHESILDGSRSGPLGTGTTIITNSAEGVANWCSCASTTEGCYFRVYFNSPIMYTPANAPFTLLAHVVKLTSVAQGGGTGIAIVQIAPTGLPSTYYAQISDMGERPGCASTGWTSNRAINNSANGNWSSTYGKPITCIAWIENSLWNFQTSLTYTVTNNSDGGVGLNEVTWSNPCVTTGVAGWTSSPGGMALLFGAGWLRTFNAAERQSLLDNPYQFLIPA